MRRDNFFSVKSMVGGTAPPPANVPCNGVDGTHFAFFALSTPLLSEGEIKDKEDVILDDQSDDVQVFPEKVYENLPEPFASAVRYGRSHVEKTMILTASLVCISSTMVKKVSFNYSKQYLPNLMSFIIGSASSGKGKLPCVVKLIEAIHRDLAQQSEKLFREYESNNSEDKPLLIPKRKLFLLPINLNLPTLDSLLADNDGCGLMFTSDGGHMMAALRNEYGDYSNDLLSSSENEGISRARKTNHEYFEIPRLRFSVLVASTWAQIGTLFGDGLNGLFSRPIFLNLPKSLQWKSQWEQGEMPAEAAFEQLGWCYKKLYDRLNQCDDIEFRLTKEQQQQFDDEFSRFSKTFVHIYGENFVPSVRRMAVNALRIMCIITVLRYLNDEAPIPTVIYCRDDDFGRGITMADIFLRHAGLRSHYLAKTNSTNYVKPWLKLLEALPKQFKRNEAVETGKLLCIAEARTDKYLKRLCEEGKLQKIAQGIYEK